MDDDNKMRQVQTNRTFWSRDNILDIYIREILGSTLCQDTTYPE
jgi:hypothetical protein